MVAARTCSLDSAMVGGWRRRSGRGAAASASADGAARRPAGAGGFLQHRAGLVVHRAEQVGETGIDRAGIGGPAGILLRQERGVGPAEGGSQDIDASHALGFLVAVRRPRQSAGAGNPSFAPPCQPRARDMRAWRPACVADRSGPGAAVGRPSGGSPPAWCSPARRGCRPHGCRPGASPPSSPRRCRGRRYHRAGMAHAAAGRRGGAGDEAHRRLLHLVAAPGTRPPRSRSAPPISPIMMICFGLTDRRGTSPAPR